MKIIIVWVSSHTFYFSRDLPIPRPHFFFSLYVYINICFLWFPVSSSHSFGKSSYFLSNPWCSTTTIRVCHAWGQHLWSMPATQVWSMCCQRSLHQQYLDSMEHIQSLFEGSGYSLWLCELMEYPRKHPTTVKYKVNALWWLLPIPEVLWGFKLSQNTRHCLLSSKKWNKICHSHGWCEGNDLSSILIERWW